MKRTIAGGMILTVFLFVTLLALPCWACEDPPNITVSDPVVDTETGGGWTGVYGDCFFLLADPQVENVEELVGPNWYSCAVGEYDKTCFGGKLVTDGVIDWRVFIHDQLNGNLPISAFSWTGAFPYSSDPSAEQWNPCINDGSGGFKGTTFDDDNAALYDPLVMELKINRTGSLKLAYYFFDNFLYWEAAGTDLPICRTEDFKLIVNGVVQKTGSISDFSSGKFVVFELSGLTGETLIRFEVQKSVNDECSGEPYVDFIPGFNSHLSGVFVNCVEKNLCVDIEKYASVDGGVTYLDADQCNDAPKINGKGVYYKIVVTNCGTEKLSKVYISDKALGCSKQIYDLDVGASKSFKYYKSDACGSGYGDCGGWSGCYSSYSTYGCRSTSYTCDVCPENVTNTAYATAYDSDWNKAYDQDSACVACPVKSCDNGGYNWYNGSCGYDGWSGYSGYGSYGGTYWGGYNYGGSCWDR